jgi:hypothetical protein
LWRGRKGEREGSRERDGSGRKRKNEKLDLKTYFICGGVSPIPQREGSEKQNTNTLSKKEENEKAKRLLLGAVASFPPWGG